MTHEPTFIVTCCVCNEPARGFVTVRFFGDGSAQPYEGITENPACQACCDKDIWNNVIGRCAIALSGKMGRVIAYGDESERAQKRDIVLKKGLKFQWCPRIYVGLTPFDDERVEGQVAKLIERCRATAEKEAHVQEGGKLQ